MDLKPLARPDSAAIQRANHRARIGARSAGTLVALAALGLLAACNGDEDPAAATALTITGTATSDTALAGATVQARCAAGSGSTTSSSTGDYTLEIEGGQLPCALRATAGSTTLHTVATGSGDGAAAQVTPATELVVAHLAGGAAPAAYFDGFGAATAPALTPAAASAAVRAVSSALGDAGLSAGGVADLLTTPLPGAHAQLLAALNANLAASQTPLATVAAAVATAATAASGSTPADGGSAMPSLPAAQLMAPAAPGCASLRSARYRVVVNQDNAAGVADNTSVVTIDGPALKLSDADGATWTLTPTGDCRFALSGNGGEMVVSLGGVIAARFKTQNSSTSLRVAVLFPEQTHALAALAGEWNGLGMERDRGVANGRPVASTATLDASGRITAFTTCDPLLQCQLLDGASLPALQLVARSDGGFDLQQGSSPDVDRVYAYRGGSGDLMFVTISGGGHLQLHTRKVALAVPSMGRVRASADVTINANYGSTAAMAPAKNTVSAVDAANGRFTRDAVIYPAGTATRPETLVVNEPRPGYTHRLPITATASDGSSVTPSEFYSLQLAGMGFAAVAFPASNALLLSAVVTDLRP